MTMLTIYSIFRSILSHQTLCCTFISRVSPFLDRILEWYWVLIWQLFQIFGKVWIIQYEVESWIFYSKTKLEMHFTCLIHVSAYRPLSHHIFHAMKVRRGGWNIPCLRCSILLQLTVQVIDDVHKGCRVALWRMYFNEKFSKKDCSALERLRNH